MGEAVKKAIRAGDMEVLAAEKLRDLGVGVNDGIGRDGYTSLHWACHYGNAEVLQHLLELGADVSLRTKHGWTGVHICAIRGSTVCLQVLISSGADLRAADSRGYTCAHLATAHGKCSILQAITKTGVDVSVADRRGWSVVHHAAFHGRVGVMQLLSKMDLDLLAVDREGSTPAHLAAAEGHLECLRLLVYHKHKAAEVVNCRNNNGATPKDMAVQFYKQDCVDFLSSAESEADANESCDSEEYPAHSAAQLGNLQLLNKLIQEGHCTVNDRDKHDATPAHKAAGNGHKECLQWLIDHGADVSLKNNAGETPKDVAKGFAQAECVTLLAGDAADSDGDLESGDESLLDQCSPQALARDQEKVEELQRLLGIAKTHYQQLGGELVEDSESRLLEMEHKKQLSGLESQLEYERERREVLEAELDQLRKQLQETTSQLQCYQALPEKQAAVSPEMFPSRSHSSKRKPKKRNTTGGAFIRIAH